MAKSNIFRSPFPTSLNTSQVITSATVALVAGQMVEIGRFTVQAGVGLTLGQGAAEGQDSAIGRIYANFRNTTPADVNGMFRIDVENASKRVVKTIFERRSEQLRTDVADRRKQIPFPQIKGIAGEDVSYVFRFMADAAGTLSQAQSTISLDATSWEAE